MGGMLEPAQAMLAEATPREPALAGVRPPDGRERRAAGGRGRGAGARRGTDGRGRRPAGPGHRTTGPSGHRRSGRLAAATLFDCSSVVLQLSGSEPSARPGTRWSDDRQAGRPPVVSGKPAESAPAGGARRADRTGSSARSGVPSRHARPLVHAIRSPRRHPIGCTATTVGRPPGRHHRHATGAVRTPNDVVGVGARDGTAAALSPPGRGHERSDAGRRIGVASSGGSTIEGGGGRPSIVGGDSVVAGRPEERPAVSASGWRGTGDGAVAARRAGARRDR